MPSQRTLQVLPSVVVLLHAVAPSTWQRCRRVLAAVREVAAVPVTLLAVPRYKGQPHDARFDAELTRRLDAGDELALHGYMHEDDSPPRSAWARWGRRASPAEFRSLACDDALQRLHAGMRWFQANGWPLAGFAAPRWALGAGAREALGLTPLLYTLTRDAVLALNRDELIPTYSIEHRTATAWSRAASLAWNAAPGRLGQDTSPLVRLELTPEAADHAAVRRAWQCSLHRLLCWRQAHTLARVVQHWQPAARPAFAPAYPLRAAPVVPAAPGSRP
jgi:predicted deacetylase